VDYHVAVGISNERECKKVLKIQKEAERERKEEEQERKEEERCRKAAGEENRHQAEMARIQEEGDRKDKERQQSTWAPPPSRDLEAALTPASGGSKYVPPSQRNRGGRGGEFDDRGGRPAHGSDRGGRYGGGCYKGHSSGGDRPWGGTNE